MNLQWGRSQSQSRAMFVLVSLVLFVVAAAGGREAPDILTGEGGSVRVKLGSQLVLICHGDDALHWSVGHVQVDDRFKFIYSTVRDNATGSRPYATTLTLSDVNSNDVGVFTCAYNNTGDKPSQDESTIYVLDDEELLVKQLQPVINGNVGQRLIVPCRPTQPSVKIEMTFNTEKIPLDQYKYDPQIGFIIDPVEISSSGLYSCIGSRGSVQKIVTWLIHIAPAGPSHHILRTPLINATNDGIIHVGSDFTLDCFTEEESYVYYTINWTEPANVINSGRATVLPPISLPDHQSGTNRKKAFKSQLKVRDARKEDSATYVCNVSTQNSFKTASKVVSVYGKGDHFLNVTTNQPNIEEQKGFDARWVINISSYPTSIDFVWTDRNGLEIGRDPASKYRIERKNNVVILKILNTSLKNFGPYKFTVRVRDFKDLTKSLDLNLTVLARPEVLTKPNKPENYFEYDKNYTMKCNAIGFPLPDVSWYFLDTNLDTFDGKLLNCKGDGMKLLKAVNITKGEQFTSSTINFRPKRHGVLLCSAANNQGIDCKQRLVKVIDFPGEKEFAIMAPDKFIEQDLVKLTCALTKVNKTNDIQWKKVGNNAELMEIQVDNSSVIFNNIETPWSWQRSITFPKINKSHAGNYVCLVGGGGGDKVQNETLTIQVLDMVPPKIHATNLNQTEVTLKEGEPPELRLYCRASGTPQPTIEWRKDGLLPSEWPEEIKYRIDENEEALVFSYIRSVASGKYSCTAHNRNGTDSVFMDIEVEGNGIHPALIGFIVVCVVVILILMFCIIKKNHKKRVMERYLKELQKKEFEDGAVENINPELGIEDQACLLPYDKSWEFPRNRLRLGMQLGSGAFGRVMKAEAVGINKEEPVTTVAVKMVKANADESHIKALMSELKIMVHLGRHVNVVNLLGAVTTSLVKKKELFVIVEYCKYGSLLNYMHRHRHTFINQLDPVRGVIDSSIYSRIGSRFSQQSEAPRLNYASLTFTDTGNSRTASNGYRTLDEITSQQGDTPTPGQSQNPFDTFHLRPMMDRQRSCSSGQTDYYPGESHMESMCTDMSYISNSPTVFGTDGKRRSSGASSWAEGHYRGDYHHVDVRPIRSVDLLGWAFQVTRGMEYLASRKVLHGDLAARNVLLAENNVVKICDFGLAKEMYKDYKYKKKSEGVLLPVKWMAIESIYFGVFSTQSDVWSYGVVLWELFTLGKTPYPGMEADDRFYKMLSEGYRMEKPPLAPSAIYDLMLECWAHEPSERPTFSTLVDRIGDLMDEGHRQQYFDLNVPYDKMNRELFSGKEDYLSKMSGPEFTSASNQPTPERQYENIPQNVENSGYLIPISPNAPQQPSTSSGVGSSEPQKSHKVQPVSQYQNVIIHEEPQPHGHILANNAGYVFMSRPAPEGATSYVKIDYEPETFDPKSKNIPSAESRNNAENNHNPINSNRTNDSREITGISNVNYVPNNIFFPKLHDSSSPKTLELVGEEDDMEPRKVIIANGTSDLHNQNNHSQSNNEDVVKQSRHLRRHKNDSGLGSIDSTHFDFRNPADKQRESDESADLEYDGKEYGCQHNVAYVSVGVPSNSSTSNSNGGKLLHNGNHGVIV